MKKDNKINLIIRIKSFLFFVYILIYYMFGSNPETVKYSEILLLVLLAWQIIDIIKKGKMKCCIPIVSLFVFDFFCLISNFWAIYPELSVEKAKTLFILSSFLLIMYNLFIDIENSEEILLKTIMYAGIVFSIYVIMYYGIGEYFNRLMSGERMGSEINNVNEIGLQTAIAFIIVIFFTLYSDQKKYLLLAIIPLIVALGTGSKKVLILIVLGTLMVFLLKKEEKFNLKKISKKIIFFTIIVCAFIYVSQLPMFSTIFSRFKNMTNIITGEGKAGASTETRSLFIKSGINQFFKTPILGIGIANSGYITMQAEGWATYLHNNFVELLACTGIIGFVLYYSVYLYIILNCFKFLKKKNKYVNLVLVIFIVNLVLEYGFVSYSSKTTYIYILFGLIVIEKMKKENRIEKNNQVNKKT